jgi:Fe-S-cluster-containing hydrogenase component 2
MAYTITDGIKTIPFIRTGTCDRCPLNQPAPCCIGCPHFAIVDKVNTCLIYATRNRKCDSCIKLGGFVDKNGTHADCIDWPQHPLMDSIKTGACKFKFTLANPDDKATFDEANSKW